MLAGKIGFLHIHNGNIPGAFAMYEEIVSRGFPVKHIRPTHCGRIRHVFDSAVQFALKGGWIDITTGASCCFDHPAQAVVEAIAAGVDPTHITLSTDGHGSVPRFNDKGEMVGLGVGGVDGNLKETIRLIRDHNMPIEQALTFTTSNVAGASASRATASSRRAPAPTPASSPRLRAQGRLRPRTRNDARR